VTDEPISFTDWLTDSLPVQETPDKKYRHRRLDENAALRQRILPRLKQVVFEAHEDARRHIRDIEGVSLNPVEISEGQDPAAGYPGQTVHTNNLMGYFGEVLTSIICEEFAPFGDARWEVPAYFFRFHYDEDRHREQVEQIGKKTDPDEEIRPGRTGEDCLAFIMDETDNITHTLICEAKCRTQHTEKKIQGKQGEVIITTEVSEAHQKISERYLVPLDRPRIIEILRDYSPQEKPKASKWITALQKLRFEEQRVPGYQRFDLICCIYGTIRRQGQTWIPREAHHPAYKGGRFLEAIEIYIRDVKTVVREVYDYQGPADDLE